MGSLHRPLLRGGAPLAARDLPGAIVLFEAVRENVGTVRARHEVEVALIRRIECRVDRRLTGRGDGPRREALLRVCVVGIVRYRIDRRVEQPLSGSPQCV